MRTILYGLPRKGKTLFMIQYGLILAEKYQKKLVANFPFKPDYLVQLTKMMGLNWVLNNIDNGIIIYISPNSAFEEILSVPDSVVLVDEVALYAPRRDGGTPKQIKDALAMSGKLSQYIIFSCQFPNQVDEGIKDFVQTIFHADGYSAWSPKLRNEVLVNKSVRQFTIENFKVWWSDPKLRRNPIKSKILTTKSWSGFLNCIDSFTFKSYDSFIDFRAMPMGIPDNDGFNENSDYPYSNLPFKNEHNLNYYPISTNIMREITYDTLEAMYNSNYEDDIYSKYSSGLLPSDRSSKSRTRGKVQTYNPVKTDHTILTWIVYGNNLIKLHKYSKLMSFLYNKIHPTLFPKLLKLDQFLQNINPLEEKIIRGGFFATLAFVFLPFFLR
jgi:hypothetical protein